MHLWIILFWVTVPLFVVSVLSKIVSVDLDRFIELTQSNFTIKSLGSKFYADSPISCILNCTINQAPCENILYNSRLNQCSKAIQVWSDTFGSKHLGNDEALFVAGRCRYDFGFHLMSFRSINVCVLVSMKKLSFYMARKECSIKRSKLFVAQSDDKLKLFHQIVDDIIDDDTWLGLSYHSDVQKYMWENGKPLSEDSDESDEDRWYNLRGGSSEGCVESDDDGRDRNGLNSESCSKENSFICEGENN